MKRVTYSFECDKACRSLSDMRGEGSTRELWTLTVAAGELPTTFKLGPNARHATEDKPLVRKMLKTLKDEPGNFVFFNGGMMVVAESIRVTQNRVTLVCNESGVEDEDIPGHGILNGGHTYLALCEALTSPGDKYAHVAETVSVMITVAIGIDDADIADISRARNTSEKVPEYALRELKGDWKILKQKIPAATRPLVEMKPGDPEAPNAQYNITDLVKRIALVNTELFPAQNDMHPTKAYTSIGSLVTQFSDEKFQKYAHLLPDVLWLEEQIRKEHEAQNGQKDGGKGRKIGKVNGCATKDELLPSGYVSPLTIAVPFTFPIIAAFRVFIDADGKWSQPINELWDRWGSILVERTWEHYHKAAKSSAAVFGRDSAAWSHICQPTLLAAVRDQLVDL